jgi:glycosyltransferase involved in cell wall biosynthesis
MKISVVTVVLNAERTLAASLKSVASQSYSGVEHLLIDGGSTDGTLSIARQYGTHLATCISEPDKGIYDAMNKGAPRSTGDVIAFLNADDFYASPYVIEKVAQIFQDESIEACYGDLQYVDQHNPDLILRYWQAGAFTLGKFASGWAPPHPAFFVRRSVFFEAGGFNLRYKLAADNANMMKILECMKSKSSYIPEVLVKMRTGGATNKNIKNIIRGNLEILNALNENGIKINIISYIFKKIALKMSQRIAGFRAGSVR